MINVVCGIDPGTRNIGICFLEHTRERTWFCRHVETLRLKTDLSLAERLTIISSALSLSRFGITPMRVQFVVEEQEGARNAARLLGETNFRADRVERVIGMIWQVAHAAAFSVGPMIEVTPAEIRRSLGFRSGATKGQIALIVQRIVKGLPKKISNHAYDAVAIAIAGARKADAQRRMREATERRAYRLPSSVAP